MRRVVLASFFFCGILAAACSSNDGESVGGDGGPGGDGAHDAGISADGSTAERDAAPEADAPVTPEPDAGLGALTVTSPAFTAGASIPNVHSCDGAGASIPLAWSGAPASTQSYAVVMRDLSVPGPNNYHWVLWDIPASTTSLPQGIAKTAEPPVPAGSKQTAWSFGPQLGYGNMCPPSGTHEYELSVYAFPTATLPSAGDPTSAVEVDAIVQANKSAAGSLVGTYTRDE